MKILPPVVEIVLPTKGVPAQLKNVNAAAAATTTAAPDPLRDFLQSTLDDGALDELAGPATAAAVTAARPAAATLANVSAMGYLKLAWSMLTDTNKPLSDSRLETLRRSFRELDDDNPWDEGTETGKSYLKAAKLLMTPSPYGPGFTYVVFGHTHHAKQITVGNGAYLNSGTWANLMKFPKLDADRTTAMAQLKVFVDEVEKNQAVGDFVPTYVKLDVNDLGKVASAKLCKYDYENKRLDD